MRDNNHFVRGGYRCGYQAIPLPEAPEPEQPTQVLDLVAALNASVEKAKASRREGTGPTEVHKLPKPKKKTAAKKQQAKKTTGRRPRSA